MLRINLLPSYVALARASKKLFVAFSLLFVVIVVVLMGWYLKIAPQVAIEKQMADDATAAKAKVDAINAEAQAVTASIAPIQDKLTFYDAAQKFNTAYLGLYHNIFMYTSPDVLYNSLTVAGTTMTITGYTPSFSALGRYLLEMYHEPDITNLTLSSPIPDSSQANPNTPQAISLPAGVVGHLPGYDVPVTSYTVYEGKITAVNQGGTAASSPLGGGSVGVGAPPPGLGQASGAQGSGAFDLRHDGFPFTVVLTLKTALVPPSPPGSGSTGASGGNGPSGRGTGAPPNGLGTGMPPPGADQTG